MDRIVVSITIHRENEGSIRSGKRYTLKEADLHIMYEGMEMLTAEQFKICKNLGVLSIFFAGGVWVALILFQFMSQLMVNDYEFLREYYYLALTLFGITLLGGIFERKSDNDTEKETLREIFKSSILFLVAFLLFFFLHALCSLRIVDISGWSGLIFILFLLFAIIIFIVSLLGLWIVLMTYYVGDRFASK